MVNLSARTRLFRAVHAEALRRGMDHNSLRELCVERFGVASMSELNEKQLGDLYHDWTGKGLRRVTPLPRKPVKPTNLEEMITSEDMETLARAFAAAGWGVDSQKDFIARQLGGSRHRQILTRAEFWKVFSGIRAINRRKGAA